MKAKARSRAIEERLTRTPIRRAGIFETTSAKYKLEACQQANTPILSPDFSLTPDIRLSSACINNSAPVTRTTATPSIRRDTPAVTDTPSKEFQPTLTTLTGISGLVQRMTRKIRTRKKTKGAVEPRKPKPRRKNTGYRAAQRLKKAAAELDVTRAAEANRQAQECGSGIEEADLYLEDDRKHYRRSRLRLLATLEASALDLSDEESQ